jgi:hypothetical protein
MADDADGRTCEACKGALIGRQRRFCGSKCRARVRRAAESKAAASAAVEAAGLPKAGADPGRCRAGLESWLADRVDPPASLVEACRATADAVDERPHDSPIIGRYVQLLGMLHEVVADREDAAARSLLWELSTGCTALTHQHAGARCSQCVHDDAHLCGQGMHAYAEWNAGTVHATTSCERCGAVAAL